MNNVNAGSNISTIPSNTASASFPKPPSLGASQDFATQAAPKAGECLAGEKGSTGAQGSGGTDQNQVVMDMIGQIIELLNALLGDQSNDEASDSVTSLPNKQDPILVEPFMPYPLEPSVGMDFPYEPQDVGPLFPNEPIVGMDPGSAAPVDDGISSQDEMFLNALFGDTPITTSAEEDSSAISVDPTANLFS